LFAPDGLRHSAVRE